MKSIITQVIVVALISVALFMSIPPVPSVETGHGYDVFPRSSLWIGLIFILLAAALAIKILNFPKTFWILLSIVYVVFSFGVHLRVWV